LVVTDRRSGFLTTQFGRGGGWAGSGIAGLVSVATANAMGKRRAGQRSAGKVAIGQARHEWLTAITLRRAKTPIGVMDTCVDLTVATAAGPSVIELWGRRVINEELARWLAGIVSGHRLALISPESADEIATLQRYQQGGHDPARTGKRTDFGWFLPGKTDELIAATIASQGCEPRLPGTFPARETSRFVQVGATEPASAVPVRGPSHADVGVATDDARIDADDYPHGCKPPTD
jgi:hypothetical protein